MNRENYRIMIDRNMEPRRSSDPDASQGNTGSASIYPSGECPSSDSSKRTAFLGWIESDVLSRGEAGGGINGGADDDLLWGRSRAIRYFIAANERGGCAAEGVTDVMVVVEPEALENGGGLTAGLLVDEVTVVDGFFMEERVGGGGRVIGVGR